MGRTPSFLWRLLLPLAIILLAGGSVSAGLRMWGPSPNGVEHSIMVDGKSRDYLLFVPDDLPDGDVPLVIVLHGAYSWGEQTARQTGFSFLARDQGFIAVYPEGESQVPRIWQFWNAGHCCYKALEDGVDDIGFLEALLEHLVATQPVDPSRVYVVGFSNGGMLAHWFAAKHADQVAGLAAFSGPPGAANLRDNTTWRIPDPAAPVPTLIGHGAKDSAVLYEGGIGRSSRIWAPISVNATAAIWLEANGLAGEPAVQEWAGGNVELRTWEGRFPVAVLTVRNAGHSWPGADPVPLFSTPTDDVDATRVVWEFFMEAEARRAAGMPVPAST